MCILSEFDAAGKGCPLYVHCDLWTLKTECMSCANGESLALVTFLSG
jgi:hypothetical protein